MTEFWLGVLITTLISIPISVFSPYITKWIDKLRGHRSIKRAAQDAEFEAQSEAYAADPHSFYLFAMDYALRALVWFTMVLGILIMLGLLSTTGEMPFDSQTGWVLAGLGVLVAVLSAMNMIFPVVRLLPRVRELHRSNNHPAGSASGTQTPAIQPPDPAPALGSGTDGTSDAPQGSSARPAQQQPSEPPHAS